MKCILLYGSFGDGHVQVGKAISEVLAQEFGADVEMIDTFRTTNRFVAWFNERVFEWSTRYFPGLYGVSYDWTRNLATTNPLWSLLARFSRKAAWRALQEHRPDIVVQLFPDHALARMPKGIRPFVAVVLTDFSVHSRWFHKGVDLYILPAERAVDESARFTQDKAVVVAGIPIRRQFSACALMKQSGRSIVVLTGGRGVFPQFQDVLDRLVGRFPSHTIYVLCGRNQRMFAQVRSFAEARCVAERIVPVGFTEQLAAYLQQADFVMTKAGGVTVAECLACGVPMVFFRPLPGQERENANCVARMGAGLIVHSLRELEATLAILSDEVIAQLARRARENGRPAAAWTAAYRIVDAWKSFCGDETGTVVK
ncbi:MGDG synthase family glycosyltransferase [Alicyclobacillus hesperidum]|uniref:MGDG synthase family glycosyltransferase n=1 Tax=Alicyclobacillus hesperidum TaxID=89784 RepID=UPI0007193F01|nr:glycosyltransferase [Alicyclobacillus hesperidum]KRW92078.1 galactosyldiacylglycerol synthase [Alicyclobacillus tengchongensis]